MRRIFGQQKIMITGNPALGRISRMNEGVAVTETATYGGIARKSIFLVLLTFISAIASFIGFSFMDIYANFNLIIGLLIGSGILTFILGFVAILNPNATKIAGSIYAVLQGLTMGFTALMVTYWGFGGEVFSALLATIGVFGIMMILYSTGIIRVGSGFRKFMISALIGMLFVNLVLFLIALIGGIGGNMWMMFFGNGPLAIGINVVMVILASLMILLDLNRMTMIVQAGLDKRFEWVASFGLLITLIWLYMEFLRLFIRIASRSR
ncbi:MAG: Bax inhibitor-1/YccA family protein [Defluviitaleaceae bacterium]|nr:Bax inhibitor-1/YccA family protein [Defluviitaleaceae bacterium]